MGWDQTIAALARHAVAAQCIQAFFQQLPISR
jgi:hypothetical protein